MTSGRYTKRNGWMLGIAIALATTSACAAEPPFQAAPQNPVNVVASSNTETTPEISMIPVSRSERSSVAELRKAAMQGPEAFRRYLWRTRMIYNYYFWDFAKEE